MREDMQDEWWRAGDNDQYSLKDKLLRVGCRPLKRKFLSCKKLQGTGEQGYGECQKIKFDMEECY